MLHRTGVHGVHTHSQDTGIVSERIHSRPPERSRCAIFSVSRGHQGAPEGRSRRSAAAEFGEEIGHAEEDPDQQEVGAEGQQGQRVQQAGVQLEVAHRQQAAQVLLDHTLPRPNAAESQEAGREWRVERRKMFGGKGARRESEKASGEVKGGGGGLRV